MRFGRTANVALKKRRSILRPLGVAALLAVAVAAMVVYGPALGTKHSLVGDWLAKRHEAQRQRETEATLEHIRQVKREADALLQKSKADSETARKELDERMPWMRQPVPQQPAPQHPAVQSQAPQPLTPKIPALLQPAPQQQVQQQQAPQESQTERQASLDGKELPAAPEPQPPVAHSGAVVWLSVSPDGGQLVSASTDKSIKLWDIRNGLLVRDVGHHDDMARSALFLPGGSEVLSGADDGMVDTWSVGEGRLENALIARQHGGVRGLAISADGRFAASSHESGAIVLWDLKEHRKLQVMNGHQWPANAVAISPDGGRILSGDIEGVIRTWDLHTGKSLRLWKGHERGVYGAAFLPGGQQAVTASGDGMLKLWDVESGREVRSFPGHAGTVYAVSVSADGQKMLSGSLDGTARLWNLATGEELDYFDNAVNRVYSVALLADGSMAIGDESGTIKILAGKGGPVRTLIARAAE